MIEKIIGKTPTIFDTDPHENTHCEEIKNRWKNACLNIRWNEHSLAKKRLCKILFEDFMDCSIVHFTQEIKKQNE